MTQPKAQLTRADPELGPMRFCRRCNEWWPDDREFWAVHLKAGTTSTVKGHVYIRRHDVLRCLAHSGRRTHMSVLNQRHRRALRNAIAAERKPGWCSACLAVRTKERLCHGCAGRTRGPLTGAMLTAFGYNAHSGSGAESNSISPDARLSATTREAGVVASIGVVVR